jgi:hypothetical protein
MDVRAGGVDTQLDAQGPAGGLSLGQAGGQGLIRVGVSGGEEVGHTPLQPGRQWRGHRRQTSAGGTGGS